MPLLLLLLTSFVSASACATAQPKEPAPTPVYDDARRLVRLDWDRNGDGRVDQRTYVEGTRPVRSETDADADGRIDQWEYVRGDGQVSHLGTSSANDGVEDTWTWPADAAGVVTVERAQYRDRAIDRREYFRDNVLVRAEEDANRDGLVDKWETWERGILRASAFDTRFRAGRPDRRVLYDDRGQFSSIEADSDGDGRFEPMGSPRAAVPGKEPRDR